MEVPNNLADRVSKILKTPGKIPGVSRTSSNMSDVDKERSINVWSPPPPFPPTI